MTSTLVRKSSSLIIASKCTTSCSSTGYKHWKNVGVEDYAVILLKRSSTNKFLPDALVFPGGTYHAADSNLAWLDLFEKCGISRHQMKARFKQPNSLRADTYKRLAEEMSRGAPRCSEEDFLCPELSLRLTALRETFEETGLLLTQPYINGVPRPPLAFTERGSFQVLDNGLEEQITDLGGRSLEEWRAAVNADASKFLDLFVRSSDKRKTLLPWVEGLVEWWAWLTPLIYTAVRFDTVFYTALLPALQFQPDMLSPCNESSKLMVLRPSAAVTSCKAGESWLAPPQLYEFGRLANFKSLDQLKKHVRKRTGSGGSDVTAAVSTWLPQVYKAIDGFVGTMPGDALYGEHYSVGEAGAAPQIHCNMEMLRGCLHSDLPHLVASPREPEAAVTVPRPGQVVPLNRVEMKTNSPYGIFQVNVVTEHGQVGPVNIHRSSF